jgi:hypothetical protein
MDLATCLASGFHPASLFWIETVVLFVLLWIGRVILDVVGKGVVKELGGDALVKRINRNPNLFRAGRAVVFNKVAFSSVGDPYTAILHVFQPDAVALPLSHRRAALAGVSEALVLLRSDDEHVCRFDRRNLHPDRGIFG